jgi:hypothetical protein
MIAKPPSEFSLFGTFELGVTQPLCFHRVAPKNKASQGKAFVAHQFKSITFYKEMQFFI